MTLTFVYAAVTVAALLLSGLLGSIESALAPISRADRPAALAPGSTSCSGP